MGLILSVVVSLTLAGTALLALPGVVVEWARWSEPQVLFSVPTEERLLALTIDDGPSSVTREILEVLAEHDATATFFLIGDHLEESPGVVSEIVAAGHEIGHHMMEDTPSRALAPEVFEKDFDAMDALLGDFGGARLFRPGSGWYDERMVALAEDRGYRTVLGSVYPYDAQIPWSGFHSWYILGHSTPGSILVLHDGEERGRRTAEVLRVVLPELARGVPGGQRLRVAGGQR